MSVALCHYWFRRKSHRFLPANQENYSNHCPPQRARVRPGCTGQRMQAWDANEGALKDKDLSSSLFPSIPPLQHGEVTGKIKGENGGTGGATGVMAMQLGSLLPCLTQRDKSWLFMCLSVSPAFYQVRGETAVTPTRGTRPNGALNRLAATPWHCHQFDAFQIGRVSWMTAPTLVFLYLCTNVIGNNVPLRMDGRAR